MRNLVPLLLVLCCGVAPAVAEEPRAWAERNAGELFELYQHFHQNPELSLHEKETAARLAQEWRALGIDVTTGVGGHGVVGVLKNGPGPCLMVRTDLDALPVTEATGLTYASKVKVRDPSGAEIGVMHACGHDIHITNIIGVARYLAAHRDRFSGTIVFIGQPAEERVMGARAMLEDGLFTRFPKPDFALALHVDSTMATGKVGYRAGYALANVDGVDIILNGRGGHGASPHTTIDPIVMAARLVLDLQTIVSREIDPTEPAVVTVGSIQAGAKHNIISDSCHLKLTLRSYSDAVRQQIIDAIKRKANAVAAGAGASEPTITYSEGTPAMYNDDELVARVLPALQRALGDENVVPVEPVMGAEDFSEYGRAGVPIFMYRLGAVDAQRLAGYERVGQSPPSLHSALFYPDAEAALVVGVTTMSSAVMHLLPAASAKSE